MLQKQWNQEDRVWILKMHFSSTEEIRTINNTDKKNRCLFPTFYDMKNQFWAGLGSQAVLVKKKFGADYEQLMRAFFLCFQGQKKSFGNIIASALKRKVA